MSDRRTGPARHAGGTHWPGPRPQPDSPRGSGGPARPTGRRWRKCCLVARARPGHCDSCTLAILPEPYLTEALSGHPEHFALIAATPTAVVALASCRAVAGGTAELAVLVEDARQRQGIGARLLRRLIEHADRSGLRTLRATLLAEQEWIVGPLRAYGTCTVAMSKGVLKVTVRRRAEDRNPGADAQGCDDGEPGPSMALYQISRT